MEGCEIKISSSRISLLIKDAATLQSKGQLTEKAKFCNLSAAPFNFIAIRMYEAYQV